MHGLGGQMSKRRLVMAKEADFHVSFKDAVRLFEVLTPKRMELLRELHGLGPVTKYALAKHLCRDYSNVHKDVKELKRLGLVELDREKKVFVPWDSAEIRFSLKEKK